MKQLRIIIFLSLFFGIHITIPAQFNTAKIGVNGLTCSQCSRSVELGIKKLDFIEDVQMDLENTVGKLTFKKGKKADIKQIAGAIKDAGFSVRFIKAGFNFDSVQINKQGWFTYENAFYQFIKVPNEILKGEITLKFIGKEFLSKKEYKLFEPSLKSNCATSKEKLFFVSEE